MKKNEGEGNLRTKACFQLPKAFPLDYGSGFQTVGITLLLKTTVARGYQKRLSVRRNLPTAAPFDPLTAQHATCFNAAGASASVDDATTASDAEPSSGTTMGAPPASPVSDMDDGSECSASSAETGTRNRSECGESSGESDGGSIQLDMPRRSMQLTFTCRKCGAYASPFALLQG